MGVHLRRCGDRRVRGRPGPGNTGTEHCEHPLQWNWVRTGVRGRRLLVGVEVDEHDDAVLQFLCPTTAMRDAVR